MRHVLLELGVYTHSWGTIIVRGGWCGWRVNPGGGNVKSGILFPSLLFTFLFADKAYKYFLHGSNKLKGEKKGVIHSYSFTAWSKRCVVYMIDSLVRGTRQSRRYADINVTQNIGTSGP